MDATNAPPAPWQAAPRGGLTYAIGPHTFAALPALDSAAPSASPFPRSIVKLADFGSAEAGPGGVGEPVRSRHFTTLENAPPEHVLLGDASLQASGERGGRPAEGPRTTPRLLGTTHHRRATAPTRGASASASCTCSRAAAPTKRRSQP